MLLEVAGRVRRFERVDDVLDARRKAAESAGPLRAGGGGMPSGIVDRSVGPERSASLSALASGVSGAAVAVAMAQASSWLVASGADRRSKPPTGRATRMTA